MSVKETGRVKNYMGECSFKVTCPDGECSTILVSNPDQVTDGKGWRTGGLHSPHHTKC